MGLKFDKAEFKNVNYAEKYNQFKMINIHTDENTV